MPGRTNTTLPTSPGRATIHQKNGILFMALCAAALRLSNMQSVHYPKQSKFWSLMTVRGAGVGSVGYAIISTLNQNADLQQAALTPAGCHRVLTNHGVNGTMARRTELDKMVDHLRDGDEVEVWKVDTFGRNTRNLPARIEHRGMDRRSITEGINPKGWMGRVMLAVMSESAQLERDLLARPGRLRQDHRSQPRGRAPLPVPGEQRSTLAMTVAPNAKERFLEYLMQAQSSKIAPPQTRLDNPHSDPIKSRSPDGSRATKLGFTASGRTTADPSLRVTMSKIGGWERSCGPVPSLDA
ncbi:recombinase family protein [Arthrobacter sp. H35-D1]|uniref:recombinase family protein n=1 Tax=Arthrobacter sp. H35-D1 TaxID=3046202 RepID=UPI0024BBC1AD|nr:recombinase family protein [Arthrobacter sp. H35-D1]MDJ0315446.1 recombinase family protein [Arthrobacter sp. H35-D1]